MNLEQALSFAKASADMAVDQRGEFATLQAAVDAYRGNVRDTLNDKKASEHEEAAWAAFDAEVARLIAKL